QGALRVRGHEADVRSDGAYHHAAPAGRAGAPGALSSQRPGARAEHREERARGVAEPHARDTFAPQAQVRLAGPGYFPLALAIASEISGQNSRKSASLVGEPTSQLEKNTVISPCETSIAWRNDASARSPSTIASTSGASGYCSFLKT